MAIVEIRDKATVSLREYREFIHRCGEIINVMIAGSSIVGYADISRVPISVCPHCLQAIDYDDLQVPDNVNNFGWPT